VKTLEKRFKSSIKTPAYVIDEGILLGNLNLLRNISIEAECKILLAQKAFSSYSLYPLIGDYLAGTAASGVYEAELAYEKMSGRENHIYSPAYNHDDFMHILKICDHIVFNNFDQLAEFTPELKKAVKKREIGIRINPEFSEVAQDIYNPCGEWSRLGCRISDFPDELPDTVSGLHFHTMCEQGVNALEATLAVVEEKFGKYLNAVKWVNFGGGQLITSEGYDTQKLIKLIKDFKKKYNVSVYLEPGEAVAKNAGFLVTRVLDIMNAKAGAVAILDASAACHMPDVLEMPYRPEIDGADLPGKKPYTYMLAGNTCLAGDVMGQYSFDEPLKKGDEIVFCDMAIYTIVKNNTFNGMKLPSIIFKSTDEELVTARKFNYRDFLSRL
jgi:carboxynorspermidine decarboxylase